MEHLVCLKCWLWGFGFCNALATFSRLTNHVLEPFINKFVIVYLDDICIYSETPERHIEHLGLVLQKLREHQLFIKMPKCFLGRKETEYLGVIVGNGTLRTAPDKISVVRDWPLLETQNKLCLLFNSALTMVSLFIISHIVLRHLQIRVVKNYRVILFIVMQQKPLLKH
jgi:hypothetical protein